MLCYCAGPLGPPSSADPANTLLPLGSFTDRALQVLVPSLERTPSMVTWSPAFTASRVHPLRVRVFGGAPSHCQCATLPLSSLTSTYSQICGFIQSSLVTVPCNVTFL